MRCRPPWASLPHPGTQDARASPTGPEDPLPAQHVQRYEAAICLLVYFSLILSGLGCEIPRLLRGGQAAQQRGEWTGKHNVPGRALPPGNGGGRGTHGPKTAVSGSPGHLPHRRHCRGGPSSCPWPRREGWWHDLPPAGGRGAGERADTWPTLPVVGPSAFLLHCPAWRLLDSARAPIPGAVPAQGPVSPH